jgi:hypothetical protein
MGHDVIAFYSNPVWTRRLNMILTATLWVSVGLLGAVALVHAWSGDFNHYWGGARTLLDGGDPYVALYRYPEAVQYLNEQYHPLPWVGLFFVPFALLPFQIALRIWTALNVIMLVLGLRAVFQLGRGRLAQWQLALIGLAIVWLSARCIYAQQTTLIITTALLYGLLSVQRGNWLAGGVWFSAILFKPWIGSGALLAMLLIIVAHRQWKFVVGLMLASLAIVIATSVLWPNWWASYFQVDFSQAYGVKVDGQFVLYWPVATLFDYARYVWGWILDVPRMVFLWILLGVAVISLGIMTWYRWHRQQISDLVLVGIGTLLVLVVMPYTRYYDYCILSLYFAGVFIGAQQSPVSPRAVQSAAVIMALALIVNVNPEPWAYQLLFGLYAASWLIIGWRSMLPALRVNRLEADAHVQ